MAAAVAKKTGYGLISMRERAEAFGGRFTATHDETANVWHVEARLPLAGDDLGASS